MDEEFEKKLEKVEEILKSHNIKIDIGGCGCCGSPWVKFEYKGEVILDDQEVKIFMCDE